MPPLDSVTRELARTGKVSLTVKVVPGSSRTELAGRMGDGTLKIRVAAPPEKGKANAELCAFLAAELSVPKSAVAVVSGHTARLKRVRISR